MAKADIAALLALAAALFIAIGGCHAAAVGSCGDRRAGRLLHARECLNAVGHLDVRLSAVPK